MHGQTIAGVILPKELKDLIVAITSRLSSLAHVVIAMYALQRMKKIRGKLEVSMAMEEVNCQVAGNAARGDLHH